MDTPISLYKSGMQGELHNTGMSVSMMVLTVQQSMTFALMKVYCVVIAIMKLNFKRFIIQHINFKTILKLSAPVPVHCFSITFQT